MKKREATARAVLALARKHQSTLIRAAIFGFWAFGLGIVLWLGWQFREEIIPYLQSANRWTLFSSILWFWLSLGAIILGWAAIMRAVAPAVPFWTHVKIYSATLAARRLPGTLWYVGGRLILYKREGVSRTLTSVASGLEMGMIALTGAVIGLLLIPARFHIPIAASLPAVMVILAFLLAFSSKLIAGLAGRLGQAFPWPVRLPTILIWFACYALAWLMGGGMLLQIIRAFQPVDPANLSFIIGAWAFSGALGTLTIFLPSSFGVSDISLAFLLAQVMPASAAGSVAILTRILGILFEFVLAGIFYPWIRQMNRIKNPGEDDVHQGSDQSNLDAPL